MISLRIANILPVSLLVITAACGSSSTTPESSATATQAQGADRATGDGTLKGDVTALVENCGAKEMFKVIQDQPSIVRLEPKDPAIGNEGTPGNDKFNCVFQGAINLPDVLATWNQASIVVNRGDVK